MICNEKDEIRQMKSEIRLATYTAWKMYVFEVILVRIWTEYGDTPYCPSLTTICNVPLFQKWLNVLQSKEKYTKIHKYSNVSIV